MMKKVFILDDEEAIRSSVENILRAKGYAISGTAGNFDDALQSIKTNAPDIAICDIKLGDIEKDGIDVAKSIKNIVDIPVIFLTGHPEKFEEAAEVNPASFILKPILANFPEQLDISIKIALENHKTKQRDNFIIQDDKIKIWTNGLTAIIDIKDVVYLEADGSYTFLVSVDDIFQMTKNLKNVLEDHIKNHPKIIKISSSNAVNIDFISGLVGRGIDGVNVKTDNLKIKQKKIIRKNEEKTFKVSSYLSVSGTYREMVSKLFGI